MVTKSRFLPLILAGLLLIAQQAAIAHAAWHALHVPASAQGPDGAGKGAPKDPGKESRLCVFHAALGQVLAGAHGHASFVCAPDLGAAYVGQALISRFTPSPVSFFSRGPPVFL
jgi:hypothetical protein